MPVVLRLTRIYLAFGEVDARRRPLRALLCGIRAWRVFLRPLGNFLQLLIGGISAHRDITHPILDRELVNRLDLGFVVIVTTVVVIFLSLSKAAHGCDLRKRPQEFYSRDKIFDILLGNLNAESMARADEVP